MTLKAFRSEAKKWKVALGLKEWDIRVIWGRPVKGDPDFTKGEISDDAEGQCWWMPEQPNALIILCKDASLHTLVHEMLHIRLEGHKPESKTYDPLYERAINLLTCALLGEPEP